MDKPNIITSFIAISASIFMPVTLGAGNAPSLLDIKDSLHTSSQIIYPESFETNTTKMLENWYLKNYAILDRDADSRESIKASDEQIMERLASLPTVIEMPFNSVVRNYIDMYSERKKQLVENMLGLSLYYLPIFEQALDRHNLPLELKYLPIIESALNPVAVSRAGATGLWQFMLPTASGLGLEVNSLVDQRRDPYASSEAAAVYLGQLYSTFGDWSLAIAAYNCGPGNVNKALRRAGGGKKDFWEIYPFLPAETRGYVPAFIAANYVMNNFDKHNISPALARKPVLTDTIHVSRRVHFDQISDVLAIPVEEIRVLNPQYRRDLIPGDIRPYTLVLPSMQVYAYLANEDSIVNHNAALYARRGIVEPSDGTVKGKDSRGEYVEETVIKYHTVRRGENLTSIARKYGVTVSSIRQANKIGKKVSRGKKLKIPTVTRRYIESEPVYEGYESTGTAGDSITVAVADSVTTDSVVAQSAVVLPPNHEPAIDENEIVDEPKMTKPAKAKAKTEKAAKTKQAKQTTTKHKIKRGESLSTIARKYHVTVKALRQANNMKNDRITAGQTLIIPQR